MGSPEQRSTNITRNRLNLRLLKTRTLRACPILQKRTKLNNGRTYLGLKEMNPRTLPLSNPLTEGYLLEMGQ